MPNSTTFGTAITLEAWNPRMWDPRTEDGKRLKPTTSQPEATPYATPKDFDGQRPWTLKEEYFKDEDHKCVHFLDGLPFYLVKAGDGYFTPDYHITKPRWQIERDEILARWKEADVEANRSGQSSPLSSLSSSESEIMTNWSESFSATTPDPFTFWLVISY